jgi:signal transduction histidine kinase/CheY-like chemotaxis protein
MRAFQALPIKRQLMLIILLTCGVVVVLASAAFVGYDQYVFRQTMARDLAMLAEIVGRNSRSALSFDDADRANKSLTTLQATPHILSACLYRTNGAVFAKYQNLSAGGGVPPAQPEAPGEPQFVGGRLRVFQGILGFEGEPLGAIFLESSLSERWVRLRRFTGGVLVIMAVAFGVVFLLSSKFQGLISEPLLELARAARVVSEEKNYSVRAVKRTEGEIGFVTDQFNEMLAKIEQRDKELKAVMAQLRESEHRAQTATQAKSQFLANMSHELRTPLNAIIGFSEILSDKTFGELNEKQGRYANNILSSGRHLLQLINDLLDLAKIEAGKLTLEREEFDVVKALHDVQNIVVMLAHKKKIALSIEASPDLPQLYADQPKFKQVMYNLLSNAIKFTPEGGRVTMLACQETWERDAAGGLERVSAVGAGREAVPCVRVAVADTGIGIKPEHHERVFVEFEQVDSSYGREQEGTGLGLALTRKLVEMHGGRIWVESEGIEGKGSTFIFLVPLVRRPEAALEAKIEGPERGAAVQPAGMTSPQEGPLVLVVEDEKQAGELLEEYLRSGGYRVAHAGDGEEGVKLARELHPQAITLDILLPKRNGWEVLADLKAAAETKDIPVVIVSVTSDQQLGFSLGAIEYFVKPVSKDRLLEAVHKAALATGGAVQRVLVVDDEPLTVEFVATTVRGAGYQVIEATSGRQGIELALAQRPDLVILDLIMPQVSGFEVVQLLRHDPRTKDIPILIYTAKNLTEEDRRQLRDRVQSITAKPGKEDLLRELDRLARGRAR